MQTFDNFNKSPGTEKAIAALKNIVVGKRKLCLIYGGVGNGKTHLLNATANELVCRDQFVRVIEFQKVLTTLKMSINNPLLNYDEILNRYCDAERLILDDVGAGGSDSDFGMRILETIVVHRYGRELLTVMSTNNKIEDLPERVISRFKDTILSYMVLNNGEDYRPKKVKNE